MRAILEQAGSESGKKLPNVEVMDDVFKCLVDGQIICEVVNVMYPGAVKKINKGKQPFVQMENISNFVGACTARGCAKADMFTTPDLYEWLLPFVNFLHSARVHDVYHLTDDLTVHETFEYVIHHLNIRQFLSTLRTCLFQDGSHPFEDLIR